MNARILVCIPCFNRKAVVEQCVPTVSNGLTTDDTLTLWNDGSTEYDDHWLRQRCDWVIRANSRSYGVGIERQRRCHFEFMGTSEKYTHLYLTDSDALHDPTWREQALCLQSEHNGAPVCLYDTTAHASLDGNTIEDNPASDVIWRRVAPGISYLLTAAHVATVVKALPRLPEIWHWDWTVPGLLGYRMAISRVSYVDHIGVGGMHHPASEGLDGGDRALNPTEWLVKKRREVVEALATQVSA